MSRPKLFDAPMTRTVGAAVPEMMYKRLADIAKRRGCSVSDLVRSVVSNYLGQEQQRSVASGSQLRK